MTSQVEGMPRWTWPKANPSSSQQVRPVWTTKCELTSDDLFYLEEAAEWQLNRLRKAELVRLWKVVGMWDEEDGDDEAEASMMKPELVDGLLKVSRSDSEQA